ncbi:hypothetical protein C8J56DRAFT_972836 [Mycena floridula]|nr:hypothetical protein C8J56DRAFT_972836 [Mycena floridula]
MLTLLLRLTLSAASAAARPSISITAILIDKATVVIEAIASTQGLRRILASCCLRHFLPRRPRMDRACCICWLLHCVDFVVLLPRSSLLFSFGETKRIFNADGRRLALSNMSSSLWFSLGWDHRICFQREDHNLAGYNACSLMMPQLEGVKLAAEYERRDHVDALIAFSLFLHRGSESSKAFEDLLNPSTVGKCGDGRICMNTLICCHSIVVLCGILVGCDSSFNREESSFPCFSSHYC